MGQSGFVTLDSLIKQADVITLHVPLTRNGPHPTWHLLNAPQLERLKNGAWLINSSRGPVIDNLALRQVLSARRDLHVALDVWEHEPDVDPDLAALCALATPHVAGYSLDGKLRGTEQIYQALCDFLGEPITRSLDRLAPTQGTGRLTMDDQTPVKWMLGKALRCVYDVRDDDARFRNMLNAAAGVTQRKEGFDRLRKNYPLRRECSWLAVGLSGSGEGAAADEQAIRLLAAAGFSLAR